MTARFRRNALIIAAALGAAMGVLGGGVAPVRAQARSDLRERLATANHILYDQGIVDGFGHVSVRDPSNPNQFLLARNRAPALVAAGDILTFNLDGELVGGGGDRVYLERFIHAEIYRRFPKVQSVVHSHAASVVPFTVSQSVRLRPMTHMSGFLRGGAPVFEIRDQAGQASDLLIRDSRLGAALAAQFDGAAVVLMRGHGFTAVGDTLPQAVFRAVYTEGNARAQAAGLMLGPITYLTPGEAVAADAANDGQIDRAWDFWSRRAEIAVAPLRASTLP